MWYYQLRTLIIYPPVLINLSHVLSFHSWKPNFIAWVTQFSKHHDKKARELLYIIEILKAISRINRCTRKLALIKPYAWGKLRLIHKSGHLFYIYSFSWRIIQWAWLNLRYAAIGFSSSCNFATNQPLLPATVTVPSDATWFNFDRGSSCPDVLPPRWKYLR